MTKLEFNTEKEAIRSTVVDEKLKECRFILVASGSKNPIEKEWSSKNNYSIDDPVLQKHISSGGNYGVIPSSTIAVLDVDEKDIFDRLEILDYLKETFIVKTGSDDGYHIYLKIKDECPAKKIPLYDPKDNSKHIGEIFFSDCPAFVVGPGCTHPSGNKYLITNDAPIMEITYNQIQEMILSKVHYKTLFRMILPIKPQ
ncbi:hypothetical protein Mhun_2842 [Methanospirillum hungatei JF-1]|uniref:DNA primase/polymerase bifunctional N-terminal domain-containing protein n=1 Tax=Methanospirillum hungatei JF-1 (strain ATCC 27890 / DSM 864 / NBRC 100397 / JF-1) TaxID=323259 RepID=Q2FSR1_METHJ|nr:bifunctional DNA primase/polymerase [Methanospirillum hungatei]ABD42534.1 hypothetical protein Mhun_2842 [Methanospirillum hungatei JF-1]